MGILYLHIGPDKTGSSSVQNFLSNYKSTKIKYIKFDFKLWKYFKSRPFSDTHNNNDSSNNYFLEIKNILNKLDKDLDYIISEEGLSNLNINGYIRLRNFLSKFFKNIIIIYIYRNSFSYHLSALSQRFKNLPRYSKFRSFRSIYEVKRKNNQFIIRNCIKVFGIKNVKLIDFNVSSVSKNQLLISIFSLMKISLSDQNISTNQLNIGLNLKQVITASFLIRLGKSKNLYENRFIMKYFYAELLKNFCNTKKIKINNIFTFILLYWFFYKDVVYLKNKMNFHFEVDPLDFLTIQPINYFNYSYLALKLFRLRFPKHSPNFLDIILLYLLAFCMTGLSLLTFILSAIFYLPIYIFVKYNKI